MTFDNMLKLISFFVYFFSLCPLSGSVVLPWSDGGLESLG